MVTILDQSWINQLQVRVLVFDFRIRAFLSPLPLISAINDPINDNYITFCCDRVELHTFCCIGYPLLAIALLNPKTIDANGVTEKKHIPFY